MKIFQYYQNCMSFMNHGTKAFIILPLLQLIHEMYHQLSLMFEVLVGKCMAFHKYIICAYTFFDILAQC